MKKTISDLEPSELRGKTAIVRVDFNVPLGAQGVTDDRRIRETLPTLELLTRAGARVVLLSHLGRPDGEAKPEFSLAPVAERLGHLVARKVAFSPTPDGDPAVKTVAGLAPGDMALLENTRFLPGEEANDPKLAAFWAGLGDLFVNDAFGVAHRAHASTSGLAEAMRKQGGEAVAGLLMGRELRYLQDALRDPKRPFTGILGGAKISGKIDVISALLGRVDRLLIGGAMANTFFRAQGHDTGASLVEDKSVEVASSLLEEGGDRLVLPVDCIVADEVAEGAATRVVETSGVSGQEKIVDIGPQTRARFAEIVTGSKTIVWNGPMGVFEIDAFAAGTIAIAHAVADACDSGAVGVVGGGDSGAAVERAGVAERVSHVSTGGGASLKLLAGGHLPGLESLSERG